MDDDINSSVDDLLDQLQTSAQVTRDIKNNDNFKLESEDLQEFLLQYSGKLIKGSVEFVDEVLDGRACVIISVRYAGEGQRRCCHGEGAALEQRSHDLLPDYVRFCSDTLAYRVTGCHSIEKMGQINGQKRPRDHITRGLS